MESVTKAHSSFAHTNGGMLSELSVEFDLMRYRTGRISELVAGLNTKGFKRCGGR